MSTSPEKDRKAAPTPPNGPVPAAAPDSQLDPDELSDDDLDKVSGGFAQIAAGRVPGGKDPLL